MALSKDLLQVTAEAVKPDPLLLPFLQAPEHETQELLGRLITGHAEPIVRKIVRHRLRALAGGDGGREAADVQAEVLLQLMERLRRLREFPEDQPIADFRGYVAVAAYNACTASLRRAPERSAHWDRTGDLLERLADPRESVASEVARRAFLRALWKEIRQLPSRQCAALLLNLRDTQGRGAVALLPLTGTASIREIAQILGMPAAEFAALWNRLPLDDRGIGQLLGVSRQQVINLRKAARARLARRMQNWLGDR